MRRCRVDRYWRPRRLFRLAGREGTSGGTKPRRLTARHRAVAAFLRGMGRAPGFGRAIHGTAPVWAASTDRRFGPPVIEARRHPRPRYPCTS